MAGEGGLKVTKATGGELLKREREMNIAHH